MKAELAKYPNLEEIRWVQDEPANMGPWPHMKLNLEPELDLGGIAVQPGLATRVGRTVGRPVSVHQQELQDLLDRRLRLSRSAVYFTDRGIEELTSRRGDDEVTLAWLADRLQEFVDLNPEFEIPVERLATWLARLDDEDDD